MARETLADIIGELRLLISDESGDFEVFSDDQLQSFLDWNREWRNYAELIPWATKTSTGTTYLEFISLDKFFENDAIIYDSNYAELTPVTSDFLNARWTFASHQASARIRGFTYDLYGAAAAACEAWMAKIKFDFDFSADNQSYKESQKFNQLKEMAADFRSRAVFSKASGVGLGTLSSNDWSLNA